MPPKLETQEGYLKAAFGSDGDKEGKENGERHAEEW